MSAQDNATARESSGRQRGKEGKPYCSHYLRETQKAPNGLPHPFLGAVGIRGSSSHLHLTSNSNLVQDAFKRFSRVLSKTR